MDANRNKTQIDFDAQAVAEMQARWDDLREQLLSEIDFGQAVEREIQKGYSAGAKDQNRDFLLNDLAEAVTEFLLRRSVSPSNYENSLFSGEPGDGLNEGTINQEVLSYLNTQIGEGILLALQPNYPDWVIRQLKPTDVEEDNKVFYTSVGYIIGELSKGMFDKAFQVMEAQRKFLNATSDKVLETYKPVFDIIRKRLQASNSGKQYHFLDTDYRRWYENVTEAELDSRISTMLSSAHEEK